MFGTAFAEKLHSFMYVVSTMSAIGACAVVLSPSFASSVYDAISPPVDDEDYPLPPEEQQRKYAFMMEHHEAVAGTGKRRPLHSPPTLLGLAINIQGPTDAGGAPIDVDAWGDF